MFLKLNIPANLLVPTLSGGNTTNLKNHCFVRKQQLTGVNFTAFTIYKQIYNYVLIKKCRSYCTSMKFKAILYNR